MMNLSYLPALGLFGVFPALCLGAPEQTQHSPQSRQIPSSKPSPESLPESEWRSIRAAHSGWKHRFETREGVWTAHNPGQQWTTHFDGRGFLATPENADWTWGLEFESYGFGTVLAEIGGNPHVRVEGQQLTYEWSNKIEEWYINDERGLEHGFVVKERPPGGESGTPLAFILKTAGPLGPAVSADARAVSFSDAGGAAVLHYSGLKVWDADGTILPSRFESMAGKRFRLVVEESGARYPLTIDPLAQQAYLKASNAEAGDWFGRSVAISGDTVAIGAPFEDSGTSGVNTLPNNSASNSGAVYIFVRNGGAWSQEAYIKASNSGENDEFGYTIALEENTLVVGSPRESSSTSGVNSIPNNSAANAGAAYVFVRDTGVWSQQAYLKASNPDVLDLFGWSVGLSGDTIVVGSNGEDSSTTGVDSTPDNSASSAGAGYVFVREANEWSQQAYLKASNTSESDQFGISVAISEDTIVAGANLEDTGVTRSGAAYVFVRDANTWSEEALLKASNPGGEDEFGWSLAVDGDTLLVGAVAEDSSSSGTNSTPNDAAFNAGAAYVFERSGTTWSQQAYLKASNSSETELFGYHVALSGGTAVIGAPWEDSSSTGVNSVPNENAPTSGAAYVFVRSGINWIEQAYLKASNPGATDNFGASVAVSGDTVVAGTPFEDSSTTGVNGTTNESALDAGAVYIYIPAGPSPPRVTLKGKTRLTTSRARVVLRGTATNATGVTIKAGKGPFKAARGVAQWKAPIRLQKKRTVALVRATGPGGASPDLRVIITRKTR